MIAAMKFHLDSQVSYSFPALWCLAAIGTILRKPKKSSAEIGSTQVILPPVTVMDFILLLAAKKYVYYRGRKYFPY